MTLHGDISVNGIRLGRWEAVAQRGADDNTAGRTFTYKCLLTYKAETIEYTVEHDVDDGELVLAAKVLSAGMALRS